MRQIFQIVKFLTFFTILLGSNQLLVAQCNNATLYGSATAPTGGGSATISTCNWAGEYAPLNSVAASTNYINTSSNPTDFITIRQGTPGGAVIAFGTTPLNWTSTVAGTYYAHINTNAACGTENVCRTTVITHVLSSPDDPCTAMALSFCSVTSGNNTGFTDSGISSPSCGSYSGGDVWYTITIPASGNLQLEAFAGTLTDMSMSAYTSAGGCGAALTQLSCNDNGGAGNMPLINLTGLTPGNTLYIRIWDNNNDQTGDFTIRALDPDDLFCYTGNALSTGGGCAQLTSATNNQNGSIWDANDVLDFTNDWSYDFSVNLGSNDGGADGVCFVIQNDPAGLSASGTSGGAMGAGGITNSLIIEIDTYINTEDRNDGLTGLGCASGPDWDHLDIWQNGSVNPGNCTSGARIVANAVELLSGGSLYNIENGLDHTLRIAYVSGTQTFTATILNAAATVTYGTISHSPVDPMTVFGTNTPFFGFTASTGGLNNVQTGCLAPEFILPITLDNIDINCENGNVQLNWSTSSEINNDYFTIEKSTDGINFEIAATINGAGNSTGILNYSWEDEYQSNGTMYYRLKQTDFNGEHSYSRLLATECHSNNTINIYPNPANGKFSFEYYSDKFEDLSIEMYNMSGQLILQQDFNNLPLGISKSEIDIKTLSNGIYYVTFSTFNNKEVHKLTIVN